MAPKPCRECGQQVSESARVCPHCGVATPSAAAAKTNRQVAAVGCTLAALIPLVFFWFVCADINQGAEQVQATRSAECADGYRPVRTADYDRGTALYFDGELYGTVSDVDYGHRFPDGSRGTAVTIRFPSGEASTFKANLGQFGYEVRC